MQGIADSFSFILGYFRSLLQCHKHLNYALSLAQRFQCLADDRTQHLGPVCLPFIEGIREAVNIRGPRIWSKRPVTNATIAFAIFSPPIDECSMGFA